jgi:hypothetical protein
LGEAGEPLDVDLRRFMEDGFGCDFADVVVHRSGTAEALCRRLGKRAFAHGSHVCVAEPADAREGIGGRRLMARALASVVQQRLHGADRPDRSRGPLNRLLIEMEADQAADAVANGGRFACTVADDGLLAVPVEVRTVRYKAPSRRLDALLPRHAE